MTDVIDPALHTGIEFSEADFALSPISKPFAQSPRGFNDFAGFQPPMRWVH